jgi:hypothetical protein
MNHRWVIALLAIVLFSVALRASAQADVQKRLDDLERRVNALEAERQQTPKAPSSASRSAWRRLANGMSPEKVRALLGEPDRIDGGTVAMWYWKSGGRVPFINDEVTAWTEPR